MKEITAGELFRKIEVLRYVKDTDVDNNYWYRIKDLEKLIKYLTQKQKGEKECQK